MVEESSSDGSGGRENAASGASEGPADTGRVGLTIPQFAQLVYSLGDVRNAYGLDGGTSCNMVFHMQKINSVEGKIRPLRDIIYFASAWEDD